MFAGGELWGIDGLAHDLYCDLHRNVRNALTSAPDPSVTLTFGPDGDMALLHVCAGYELRGIGELAHDLSYGETTS